MHFYLGQVVLFYKDQLEAHAAGIVDDATMEAYEGFPAQLLSTPGGRVWWAQAGGLFTEEIRSRLSRAMETAPPYNEILPFLQPRPPAV